MLYKIFTINNESLARQNCIFVADAVSNIMRIVGTNIYFRVKTYSNMNEISSDNTPAVIIFKKYRDKYCYSLGDVIDLEFVLDDHIFPKINSINLVQVNSKYNSRKSYENEDIPILLTQLNNQIVTNGEHVFIEVGSSHRSYIIGFESTSTTCIFVTTNISYNNKLDLLLNINPAEMGIGGLDEQISLMLRRVFYSRVLSDEMIEKLNVQHTKGLILYGPPGTGKTLIARKLSSVLGADSIKVVNGPEILGKYVGDSEGNIRNLFVSSNTKSLNVIILDECDCICGSRNNNSHNVVQNNVINQLLSMMDGVDRKSNNIVIGLTNRLDIIDPALLRPGRFEVQIEIKLPEYQGRIDILKIYTRSMIKNNMIDEIDYDFLSLKTNGFSGADLEALIRNATSIAINRCINKNIDIRSNKQNDGSNQCIDIYITKEDIYDSLDQMLVDKFSLKKCVNSNDNIVKSSNELVNNLTTIVKLDDNESKIRISDFYSKILLDDNYLDIDDNTIILDALIYPRSNMIVEAFRKTKNKNSDIIIIYDCALICGDRLTKKYKSDIFLLRSCIINTIKRNKVVCLCDYNDNFLADLNLEYVKFVKNT